MKITVLAWCDIRYGEKYKAEISPFSMLHSVEKLVTQGQRPKAECKVLPREILHQLPFPGSSRLGMCWQREFSSISLLPMYLQRGSLLKHEYNEGMEQILPFRHTSAQLPTGLTHSTRLRENQ